MSESEFFESLYRDAGRDRDRLGWTRSAPAPMLAAWLQDEPRTPGRAMVVACGVGDDAEQLATHGWEVTAFDISPTAIAWCHERFPHSVVDYVVADLFDLPEEWNRAFDLVVEVWTIQSIPPQQAGRAIEAIAALVTDGGSLLVSALTSDAATRPNGPPWPVLPQALSGFVQAGLTEVSKAKDDTPYPSVRRLEIEYRRH